LADYDIVRGTATHFADWVFRKNNPNYQNAEHSSVVVNRKKLGQYAHVQIDRIASHLNANNLATGISSNWKLVYADACTDMEARTFFASRLLVDGKPMRCRPDVVFRDEEKGIVVILERKTTTWEDSHVPPDAWPNVCAQLWCYGWIDDWAANSDVILVCQYYRMRIDWTYSTAGVEIYQDEKSPWILNYEVLPAWQRSDNKLHTECLRYFSDYGGNFVH